ncbi:DUF5366 family protein [Peribacillus sp. FSL M8-0224]|uniref:DUF5366 family protein n=1 Tax=Peribacillus sp. FSL M8-0224 TaxID=2921568 RepID=UPI0030FA0210
MDGEIMKNTYLFSYLPIISILLFSLSFAIYGEMQMLKLFGNLGIYQGMLEFFSEAGIKLALLIVLLLLFFRVFAALKLISDTILELSLLFFSKDSEGKALNSVRKGSVIYVIGGACSLFSVQFIFGLGSIFIATNVVALIYFVNKLSPSLNLSRLVGLVFFPIFVWTALISIVAYAGLKLYNSVIASLPI